MCRLISNVVGLVAGYAILILMCSFVTYVPMKFYADYAEFHCVASLEDGVAPYLRALQKRCAFNKNVWVLPTYTDSFEWKFWCHHYHVVSHTNIMARMQVMKHITWAFGQQFVYKGAIHLIEGSCNDMYNPTAENTCVSKYGKGVTQTTDARCLHGYIKEQIINSTFMDYVQCVAGNYRDLMVKFVDAKMVRYQFDESVILNRITFHWPVTGKDSDCKILDDMFV